MVQPNVTAEFRSHIGGAAVSAAKVIAPDYKGLDYIIHETNIIFPAYYRRLNYFSSYTHQLSSCQQFLSRFLIPIWNGECASNFELHMNFH